jgi:hypothetical protein
MSYAHLQGSLWDMSYAHLQGTLWGMSYDHLQGYDDSIYRSGGGIM